MVKAYLRYDFTGAFGVITNSANPEFDATGKQIITGALENALIWNIKQGTQVCIPYHHILIRVALFLGPNISDPNISPPSGSSLAALYCQLLNILNS